MISGSRKIIFIAACMGMLTFGIVITMLGSVLPSVIEKFHIDMIDAGSLFLILNLGMLAGSLIFGPLVDRYGYKGLLVICAALIFVSIEGIAFSPSIGLLRLSLFFAGFAGGAINGGTNALVSDISGENRGAGLSFLGVFFGIGALSVPFLLGTLLDRFSYESLTGFVGALILLPLLLFSIISFPVPKHEQGFPLAEGLKLTRETTLLLLGLILFMQSGMEITVAGWSATFFNEELNIKARQAVLFLSFYWLGMIMARFALSKILLRISKETVMLVSLIIAFTGSMIMLLSGGAAQAITGLILTGIGFAAVYPLVFAYAGDLYPKLSGTAFGVILAIALVGGMTYPYLVGLLAEGFNLRISFGLVPVTLICSAFLFYFVTAGIKRPK